MFYHFKYYKEKNGYWAEGVELKNCSSQGDTLSELKENLKEALNLHLSEPPESKTIFPSPSNVSKKEGILEIEVDPRVWMAMKIRESRLKSKLTQLEVAKCLGSTTNVYQRLERPKTCNPTALMLMGLQNAIPSFRVSDLFEGPKKLSASAVKHTKKIAKKHF